MTTNDRAFDKFLKKPVLPSQAVEPDEALSVETPDDGLYHPFKLGRQGKPQLRLRLYAENDVISLMTYSYLTEAVTASHQYLTLVFTNCIFDLFGRNLTLLLDPLQDARIRALYCYRKDRYPEPSESEPVILNIRREALYTVRGTQQAANAR